MTENIDNITKSIRDRIVGVLSKDSTPVQNSVVEQVATKVAKEVAPVLVNASNSEPWFQSRIWWGLIIAGVGAVSSRYGLVFGINDIEMLSQELPRLITNVGEIAEIVGVLIAAYGRAKGSTLKPLFSGK